MNTNSKEQMVTREGSRQASAEQRLKELGIKLPAPPEPFGSYVEAVQTGNLLFLSGMLPTEGHLRKREEPLPLAIWRSQAFRSAPPVELEVIFEVGG
jgi:hypothetical protein